VCCDLCNGRWARLARLGTTQVHLAAVAQAPDLALGRDLDLLAETEVDVRGVGGTVGDRVVHHSLEVALQNLQQRLDAERAVDQRHEHRLGVKVAVVPDQAEALNSGGGGFGHIGGTIWLVPGLLTAGYQAWTLFRPAA